MKWLAKRKRAVESTGDRFHAFCAKSLAGPDGQRLSRADLFNVPGRGLKRSCRRDSKLDLEAAEKGGQLPRPLSA
jgi:hypothetical protein